MHEVSLYGVLEGGAFSHAKSSFAEREREAEVAMMAAHTDARGVVKVQSK